MDLNLPLAVKSELVLIMYLGGMFLSSQPTMGVGWVLDRSLSFTEVAKQLGGTFVAVTAIFAVNMITAQYSNMETIGIGTVLFSQVTGSSEEIAIRAYVLNFIENTTHGNSILAILGSSFFGALWHAAIYGAREPVVIIVVFICFTILGWVYVQSTRMIQGQRARPLSVTMLAHILVNFTAGLRGVRLG